MYKCKEFDLDYFSHAPVVNRYTREIPTSPEILFAIFDDEHSWPQWVPGIAAVEWTSPRPFGVETTRTVTFKGGMQVYERFIAWNHGKEMAFCFTGATQRVWSSFGEYYQVEDLGGNRCQLTWTVAYEPRFIFAKLHFLFGPLLKRGLSLIMDSLVRYCRNQAPEYATKLSSPT